MELYKKHRPKTLKQVMGQKEAVTMLTTFLQKGEVPHSLLFSGPSGCGKTTIARILKDELKCVDADFAEINAADFRGIDEIRKIRQRMPLAPLGGCRIWLIDEAHKLSNDAQNAFLKMLEDTPRHVYFFLCTTDRQRLIKTILTRCTDIVVKSLTPTTMFKFIESICTKEKRELEQEVADKITDKAEGSARKALVILEQVLTSQDTDEQLNIVERFEGITEAIELARVLVNPRSSYTEAAKILGALQDDAEGVRRMILGYCTSILLKGGKLAPRAYHIINCLRDHLYDSGRAGLAAGVWEVYDSGR